MTDSFLDFASRSNRYFIILENNFQLDGRNGPHTGRITNIMQQSEFRILLWQTLASNFASVQSDANTRA